MSEQGIAFITFLNMSPVFKGGASLAVGLVALLFAFWMRQRWHEPLSWQFRIFIGVALFVTLFGLFVLVFQPRWWQLPY
ncbi:MAG: hypothetical protein MUC35_04265 [Candidatus Margulisbacteria bacterium]|jgi:hypothetical protein|nr:hypothetical protein [Candidatus Margulisiibacteriota bacterium]